MTQQGYPDFAGRIVVIYLTRSMFAFPDHSGWVLGQVRLEEQGGRLFLVGKPFLSRGEKPGWQHRASVNVAWESVSNYLVYESAEDYADSLSRLTPGPSAGMSPWKRLLGRA